MRSLLVACSLFLCFGLASCGTTTMENVEEKPAKEERPVTGLGGGVQIPNPYYNFDTLEEAEKMAGFSINLPKKEDLPQWIIRTDYRATKENLIEIIYPGDEEYRREIRFRKAITDSEDMSGDYNSYDREEKIEIGDKTVTVRINGDKIYGAIWRQDQFAYSVHISDGMSQDELVKIIEIIK